MIIRVDQVTNTKTTRLIITIFHILDLGFDRTSKKEKKRKKKKKNNINGTYDHKNGGFENIEFWIISSVMAQNNIFKSLQWNQKK